MVSCSSRYAFTFLSMNEGLMVKSQSQLLKHHSWSQYPGLTEPMLGDVLSPWKAQVILLPTLGARPITFSSSQKKQMYSQSDRQKEVGELGSRVENSITSDLELPLSSPVAFKVFCLLLISRPVLDLITQRDREEWLWLKSGSHPQLHSSHSRNPWLWNSL